MRREEILIEALPYIREFYGSKVVIKVGGHALVDESIMDKITQDVVLLRFVGICPVVVHGGGPEITRYMERLGKKPEFIGGLRITDYETMEIARMVLVGNVNERIVSLIGKHGGKGLGLSGNDGSLIVARKKRKQTVGIEGEEREVDLGWVGEIETINAEIITITSEEGYIPVISPIAVDNAGNSLNVNADSVAGEIAHAIKAKKLILLTDVPGLLRNPADTGSLISQATPAEIKELIAAKVIGGGMIPKVEAGLRAASAGVTVHIIDGREPHSILLELFTDKGIGTMIG
ncbi:MAG: acetylglutamate kinase [Methanophagales archaeon ANME-1-THS]|nr:MAG: acetylglutamate kinase [Methanophagales archaeon ANME-1-THS]